MTFQYLITHPGGPPILSHYVTLENVWHPEAVIYDLLNFKYSDDGKTWKEITTDHL